MANGDYMVPLAALLSLDRNAQDRARDGLMFTMLPGSAAQKTAVAAFAVTEQARDGLRRERRVAEQVVDAVTDSTANPAGFDRQRLSTQFPALRAVATDSLVTRIKAVPVTVDQRVADQAVLALQAAIAAPKDQKLDKADLAKYPELVAHLTDAQKGQVFKA